MPLVLGATDRGKKTKKRGMSKTNTGLTAKQEAFCRLVAAKGLSHRQAYMAAYDCQNMKSSTISSQSSTMANQPKIAQRIADIRNELVVVDLDDTRQTRSFVLERLKMEALGGDSSSARIRALELLGKVDHVSMFTPKNTEDKTGKRSSEEVKELLNQRLNKMLPAPDKE